MKIRDNITIKARAEKIWPLLVEPDFIPEWNEKIVAVKALATSRPALQAQYRFTFRFTKKETDCIGTLTTLEFPLRITWRFESLDLEKPWSVTDAFELQEKSGHTSLKRTLDLTKAPIPLIFRPLIWFIANFGRPTGITNLEKIKSLAE